MKHLHPDMHKIMVDWFRYIPDEKAEQLELFLTILGIDPPDTSNHERSITQTLTRLRTVLLEEGN